MRKNLYCRLIFHEHSRNFQFWLRPSDTGCRPNPSFLYAREGRYKSFEGRNYPPLPHWDRRAIQSNLIKFGDMQGSGADVNSPYKLKTVGAL